MRTKTQSLRLKNKEDKTEYVVTLSGEQINLIRRLYLRLEQMWIRNDVEPYLKANGDVERRAVYECWYCHRGSFENASAIQHKQECICTLSDAEWEKMNAEFIRAMEAAEQR